MPGAIVHIATGILCGLIVHFIHFKLEYSLSIFIGNLLPDVIKFGFTGVTQKNLNPATIDIHTGIFRFLSEKTSSFNFWFTIGFFIMGSVLLLYHYHVIKKKKMEEYAELYGFLLVGILAHLIMDFLFIETSWLI